MIVLKYLSKCMHVCSMSDKNDPAFHKCRRYWFICNNRNLPVLKLSERIGSSYAQIDTFQKCPALQKQIILQLCHYIRQRQYAGNIPAITKCF